MNDYFKPKYECAIRILLAKLEVIHAELSMELERPVITGTSGRIKTWESIEKKTAKKGYEKPDAKALAAICDIAGVRAICVYMDDVYRVAEALKGHQDLKIVRVKDYLKSPKNSGYRSLHLIVEVPVYFRGEMEAVEAEVQLRTSAMDFWACLDHQLRYKRGKKEAKLIGQELKEYSGVVADLDRKMVELRDRIAAI
ncbi:MAG: GTP pyrophosphokinase [Lachnospiraceae bacterium]|jgi:putative GTP pyrophosphokinase|nr:GTP pyrophosphokinase [Lachnospiraceae bacterium]MDE6929208.1 GTP pyrophosphokinase [Lachnospiraceae bacterium]